MRWPYSVKQTACHLTRKRQPNTFKEAVKDISFFHLRCSLCGVIIILNFYINFFTGKCGNCGGIRLLAYSPIYMLQYLF